ncbi:MAG: histidine phosphatase family protein [Acidobacteriota bacterium]|nr:histidine phosphatase family protein [Acidobacteriota bacterium]
MSSTKLIIIRHGETVWNVEGKKQGQFDSPLTLLGIEQAKALARRLTEEPFTALYASDLGRAYKTAEYIAARANHEIFPEPGLRERNFGIFQGLTDEQIKNKYPAEYHSHLADTVNYRIPEGESLRQFYERGTACLENLTARHAGEIIAVVTHGGIIDGWFRYIFDLPLGTVRRAKLWNASINCIVHENAGGWTLHTWGDVNHIKSLRHLDDY